jgi:predicted MPP superfamily phosphohydrolase
MWVFIILLLTDLYIWWRLTGDLRHQNRVLQTFVLIAKACFSVVFLYLVIRLISFRGEFADPANAFRYIEFGAMGGLLVSVGLLYLSVSILIRLLGRFIHKRLQTILTINIIISALLVVLFADGFFRQRFDVVMTREDITVNNLDPGLDGMKIVLISDLHLSSWEGHYDRLARVADSINAEKPDLLINAGDFITYGWQEYGGCDTILGKAHAADGAFAVAGNHDDGTYYPGYDRDYLTRCEESIRSEVSASGYTLLNDTTVILEHNGVPLAVSGVVTHGHHMSMSYGDFDRVFAEIPDSTFSILIVHDPDAWDRVLGETKLPALTLSGHTHGMQIGFPVRGGYVSPAVFLHKRWKGLYSEGDRHLFVSTGLGTMGMAVRIFMPPEIVVLTLRR